MSEEYARGLRLRSTVREDGTLEVALVEAETPPPGPDEVVIRVEAAPVNPSDLGLMFAGADLGSARPGGSAERPSVVLDLPPEARRAAAPRTGQALAVGNEGAGTVVAAGSSSRARGLLGRTVATHAGGMYAQFRTVRVRDCLPLPEGTSAVEGASCFVNPLTALGMVETMRLEGHSALVHTAAASNLGQMLLRLCLADGIDLVNIVRREEQVELLRSLGARYVCNSSDPDFMPRLIEALIATGATIAFDAVGGGRLASRILTAMEAAASRDLPEFSRYGSSVHKQVYIYGGLNRSPTELTRSYGTAWSVGGWLLTPFLEKVGREVAERLRQRVAAEIKTTFASRYAGEITLAEVLEPGKIAVYGRMQTGGKYLIRPNPARR